MLNFQKLGVLTAMIGLIAAPASAGVANFKNLTLAPGFASSAGIVNGYTGGAYSLSELSKKDIHNNLCIGYGDPKPDHIMVLQKDFPQLVVKVNTGGKDTTLVIKGPNDTFRCGDDTGSSKDATVADTNWKAGTYEIWVGAIESGQTWDYTLSVQQ
jgi:hypothetical protein